MNSRVVSLHLKKDQKDYIDNYRRELTNNAGNIPSRSEILRSMVVVGMRHIDEVRELVEEE